MRIRWMSLPVSPFAPRRDSLNSEIPARRPFLLPDAGQSAKARKNSRNRFASGMRASSDSAPAKPAFEQMRHTGRTTRIGKATIIRRLKRADVWNHGNLLVSGGEGAFRVNAIQPGRRIRSTRIKKGAEEWLTSQRIHGHDHVRPNGSSKLRPLHRRVVPVDLLELALLPGAVVRRLKPDSERRWPERPREFWGHSAIRVRDSVPWTVRSHRCRRQSANSPSTTVGFSTENAPGNPLDVWVGLTNPTRGAVSVAGSPSVLSLANFPQAQLEVSELTNPGSKTLYARTIDSLVEIPVPEPAFTILLCLASTG